MRGRRTILRITPLARTLTLLPLLLPACADGPPPDAAATEVEEWQAVPDLRLGSVDGSVYALTPIADMTVGKSGTIYTLHPQEARVRAFSADGAPLDDIGRRGEGPGEFESVTRMGWAGDTLWVMDLYGGYRFVKLSEEGDFLEEFRVPYEFPGDPGGAGPPRAAGLLQDGTIHGAPVAWTRLVVTGEITHYVPMLMDRDGRITDTLPAIPFGNSDWGVFEPDEIRGPSWYGPQPFADGPLWSFVPGEAALLRVDRDAPTTAAAAPFTLAKLTFEGDTVFSRSYSAEPVAVTRAEIDSVLEARVRELVEGGFGGERAGRVRRWAERTLHTPSFRSPVEALKAGRDGTVWLRQQGEGDRSPWLVLDSLGNPEARVSLPSRLEVAEADRDHVWGWETDALDVPYVVRYRITTP